MYHWHKISQVVGCIEQCCGPLLLTTFNLQLTVSLYLVSIGHYHAVSCIFGSFMSCMWNNSMKTVQVTPLRIEYNMKCLDCSKKLADSQLN